MQVLTMAPSLACRYVYFDVSRRLVRTNAIVLTQTKAALELVGPFVPSQDAMDYLSAVERLRVVTLRPMLDAGFQRFAWVNPGERPGGHPALSDGTDAPGDGTFVYEVEGGGSICYSLVKVDVVRQQRQQRAKEEAAAREAALAAEERFGDDGAALEAAALPVGAGGEAIGAPLPSSRPLPPGAASTPAAPTPDKGTSAPAATHAKFGAAMGQLAAAAQVTASAASKVRADLEKWRRTSVEKWMRSHGVSLIGYYALGVLCYGGFEGWAPLDSIYYLTATATTNGDEITPQSTAGRCSSRAAGCSPCRRPA